MAFQKITTDPKVALQPKPEIADINKISDEDWNNMREVVNHNADEVSEYVADVAVSQTVDQNITARHNLQNGFEIDGGFTPNYKSFVWIAPPTQTDPTLNVQGQYIQLRIAGNLNGLVNDAAASELRLSGVSNTGTGQSAHENSLVLTGGVNDINLLCGTLSNFHTSGTPTGTIDRLWLVGATQSPPIQPGLTINRAISGYFQNQIIGTENYTLYADGGQSVIPMIVPKSVNDVGLIIKGLVSQVQPLFSIQNSTGLTMFVLRPNATGGFGSAVDGCIFWVNNNLGSVATPNMILKMQAAQTAPVIRIQDSANVVRGFLDTDGGAKFGGASKNAAAILDIESTTKGVILPRMTSAQRTAIASPPEGLEVYDTTLKKKCFYNGTAWEAINSTVI